MFGILYDLQNIYINTSPDKFNNVIHNVRVYNDVNIDDIYDVSYYKQDIYSVIDENTYDAYYEYQHQEYYYHATHSYEHDYVIILLII